MNPLHPIRRDRWNVYTYSYGDGQRCLVRFDIDACDPKNQAQDHTGRRVIAFAPQGEVGPAGLPSESAFAQMRAVEDGLMARLAEAKVACWHVGTQTYNGLRELIFEVADVAAFEAVYSRFAEGRSGLELVPFEGWKFFNDKIRPGVVGVNHISNRGVIEQLRSAGSQLERRHAIDHCFIGEAQALSAVESALGPKGLRRTGAAGESLTMTHEVPLQNQDLIDSITLFMRDTAQGCGARYDGWGAMVVK